MWNSIFREELERRRSLSAAGGGPDRVSAQHGKGKLTARERLDLLFDKGSFREINSLVEAQSSRFGMAEKKIPGDGVLVGYGLISGRMACASSQDFTVIGGTLGEYHSRKICHIMDMAFRMRVPYISVNDSGGARIEEGISSLDGYSGIFYRNTRASGVIPQIAVILGPCAGGACYSPAICDFVFMSEKTANMFITGPQVVKAVLGEEVSARDLGGTRVHAGKSGVVHFAFPDDQGCLEGVRKLLSYLPQSCGEKPPLISEFREYSSRSSDSVSFPPAQEDGIAPSSLTEAGDGLSEISIEKLEDIIPDNQKRSYDVKKVIRALVDRDSFLEVQREFATNIVIGFSRIDGRTVGIVANQPSRLGGTLDIDASEKAARFVRFCDCFNIPILTLVDVPGFLPGKGQEHAGIIRKGAKLLYAYAEATVPKVSLILRKAFGGAYIAMNSKGMGADVVFALPTAQTAVMGAEGAVDIIFRHDIERKPEERERLVDDYEKHFMTPYIAAEKGFIDEIILPEEARERISQAFLLLRNKERDGMSPRKHGNIPL